MLYSEIIAVCSEIHTKHINMPCGQNVELLTDWWYIYWPLRFERFIYITHKFGPYRAVNFVYLGFKNQSVNVVQENNRFLFSEPHKHINTLCG